MRDREAVERKGSRLNVRENSLTLVEVNGRNLVLFLYDFGRECSRKRIDKCPFLTVQKDSESFDRGSNQGPDATVR